MKYDRKTIEKAFRLSFERNYHSETCRAAADRAEVLLLNAQGVRSNAQLHCNCGGVQRALDELTKPRAEQPNSQAARRRFEQELKRKAKSDPSSDEAFLLRALDEIHGDGTPAQLEATAARAMYLSADARDYQLMCWCEQMRQHGWTPAQRVAVQAQVSGLIAAHGG